MSRRGFHGRYDFSNMEVFCVCGHKLGIHCAPNPTGIRDCMYGSFAGNTQCECKSFIPKKLDASPSQGERG